MIHTNFFQQRKKYLEYSAARWGKSGSWLISSSGRNTIKVGIEEIIARLQRVDSDPSGTQLFQTKSEDLLEVVVDILDLVMALKRLRVG